MVLRAGEEARLSCGEGGFMVQPGRRDYRVTCRAGRYVPDGETDGRHLVELGCAAAAVRDVRVDAALCPGPGSGREYRAGDTRLLQLCYDEERALPLRASMATVGDPPEPRRHSRRAGMLASLDGVLAARALSETERLLSDERRLTARLRALHGPQPAGLTLTSAALLPPEYFSDVQVGRAASLLSSRAAVWSAVSGPGGNLRALRRDVSALLRSARAAGVRLRVYSGTHGEQGGRLAGDRLPVPRYIWTVVAGEGRGVALVLLNRPQVAVSEVREAVFCESVCGRLSWLRSLTRDRRYETPLLGLVFCCEVHEFSSQVSEMPLEEVRDVARGAGGLLLSLQDALPSNKTI